MANATEEPGENDRPSFSCWQAYHIKFNPVHLIMSWKRHLPINFNMQYAQYCMMTSMEDLSAQRPKRGRALCLDSRNFNCLIP